MNPTKSVKESEISTTPKESEGVPSKPANSIPEGWSFRQLKCLAHYLGRVGNTAGVKAASARAAGYQGSSATLAHACAKTLRKANITLSDYIQATGADIGEAFRVVSEGMKAKNRRAFINKDSGQVVISKPFVDAAAHEQRRKAAELVLALNGVTTRRSAVNINVDSVGQGRERRGVRDIAAGDYSVEGKP